MTIKNILFSVAAISVFILSFVVFSVYNVDQNAGDKALNKVTPASGEILNAQPAGLKVFRHDEQKAKNWSKRCDEASVNCEMVQTINIVQNDKKSKLTEMVLAKQKNGDTVVVITIPLGTHVKDGVVLDVDKEDERAVKFDINTCTVNGCVAIGILKPFLLDEMLSHDVMDIAFTNADGRQIVVKSSLEDFTETFATL